MKVIVAAPNNVEQHTHNYSGPNNSVFKTDSAYLSYLPAKALIEFHKNPLLDDDDLHYCSADVMGIARDRLVEWADEHCQRPIIIEPYANGGDYSPYSVWKAIFMDGYDRCSEWRDYMAEDKHKQAYRYKCAVDLQLFRTMKAWCTENLTQFDCVMTRATHATFVTTSEADATQFKLAWSDHFI